MPLTATQLNAPADVLANVAKTILLADPAFPFPVYGPRELIQQNINRVEVICTGAERASDHMDLANIANVQTPFYNHQRATLAFTVITARTDQQTTDNHAYALGRIGLLCRRDQQKFTPAATGGLVLLDLDDRGVTPTESEDTDTDRTLRTFDVEFLIPAAVYAAAQ